MGDAVANAASRGLHDWPGGCPTTSYLLRIGEMRTDSAVSGLKGAGHSNVPALPDNCETGMTSVG